MGQQNTRSLNPLTDAVVEISDEVHDSMLSGKTKACVHFINHTDLKMSDTSD